MLSSQRIDEREHTHRRCNHHHTYYCYTCTNNAYINGDLIFKTNDFKNSQNGHKDENFADLKICNLNIRNHTYENNSYQISNQFNLSDSDNSIIKNLNLNDSIMQESLIMKYNSKNSSTSILFYFLFFYFVLNIYLFFIKKLFKY